MSTKRPKKPETRTYVMPAHLCEKLDVLKAALEACTFDQYGCLYSVREARRVVVAARALLGLPAMPEN